MSTQESAEKLSRKRALPTPGVSSAALGAIGPLAGAGADAVFVGAGGAAATCGIGGAAGSPAVIA